MNFANNITIVIVSHKSKKKLTNLIKDISNNIKIIIENSQNYKLKKDIEEKYKNISVYLKENNGISSSLNFAGHSLRSGFATVAADSGADERSIMAMTGHKSTEMVRRYIKEANIFKNNALNKVKI